MAVNKVLFENNKAVGLEVEQPVGKEPIKVSFLFFLILLDPFTTTSFLCGLFFSSSDSGLLMVNYTPEMAKKG